jgi:hypothetical protein
MAQATKGRARPKMTFTGPEASPKPPPAPQPLPEVQAGESAVPPPQEKQRQQSRIGKRAVTFYVSPEALRQLRVMSAITDKSIQLLMEEALDWQFQQHDMHRIAKE